MKTVSIILLLGFTSVFYAQDILLDSLMTNSNTAYIEDHKKQFNVKFEISNDIITYKLPKEGIELNIKPNLNAKYAFILSYKFASLRLGIRPKISDSDKKNKGDSNSFRIHFKLLFDYWSHSFEYNHNSGFYIVNTEDFVPKIPEINDDFHIQFPNLTTNVFSGFSSYKLNENYSVRAIESQTEIQIKSAGSFMPGIAYTFYSIKGADKILFPEDNITIRDNYSDLQGFSVNLNAGYYYTYVFHKHWYANANLTPSIGIDFYKTTIHSLDEITSKNSNDISYALQSSLGLGYNGEKIFLGANYSYRSSNEKFNEDKIQLQLTKNSFNIFVGYRFKAPKSVQKSVDLLEKRIPILNEKNK